MEVKEKDECDLTLKQYLKKRHGFGSAFKRINQT